MICFQCGSTPATRLHGESGGPFMCERCSSKWHDKHERIREAGYAVFEAIAAFIEAGGNPRTINDLTSYACFNSLLRSHPDKFDTAENCICFWAEPEYYCDDCRMPLEAVAAEKRQRNRDQLQRYQDKLPR